jgi:hypothetical protein
VEAIHTLLTGRAGVAAQVAIQVMEVTDTTALLVTLLTTVQVEAAQVVPDTILRLMLLVAEVA